MKVTILNGVCQQFYADHQDLPTDIEVVIIPDGKFKDVLAEYLEKGYDTNNKLYGLPNPLSVLTGANLAIVNNATNLYNLRQKIYNDKSLESQVGGLNDIVMLLIASQVEQFGITSTATDFDDMKTKLIASQLKSLVSVFELTNPQLPPQIKDGGITEVAKEYLEFQDRVAELFKK